MFTKNQIDDILNKIIKNYDPEKIYIFGSYATKTANENSDLDILIIKNTESSFFNRIREVRKLIQPQSLPVDIITYTPIEFNEKKELVNHIAYIVSKEGKLVYERKHRKLA